MNNGLNQNIYIPIANPEIVSGVKLQNKELTNQQFFDSIFTKYISFVLPLFEEDTENIHLQVKLYSSIYSEDEIVTIDTTESVHREKVFGVNSNGGFNIQKNGFDYSYCGKPIFIDIQEYCEEIKLIGWRFVVSGEKLPWNYSLYPTINIEATTSSGGGGGGIIITPSYNGLFAVTDNSDNNGNSVVISNGIVRLNNKKINISKKTFDLYTNIIGYLIDPKKYNENLYIVDVELSNHIKVINSEITNEKLKEDPPYVIETIKANYPCDLRIVVSNNEEKIETYYTYEDTEIKDNSTDALIATIEKNKDNSLSITQQQYGELRIII